MEVICGRLLWGLCFPCLVASDRGRKELSHFDHALEQLHTDGGRASWKQDGVMETQKSQTAEGKRAQEKHAPSVDPEPMDKGETIGLVMCIKELF